jgi:DNA-binding MarR family transcriptional regulator
VSSGGSEEAQQPLVLYLVKQLELAARSVMDERLRPLGVTTLQYTALSVLARRDDLSSAQLARRSFVRPQTMHQMIQALAERGLVERRADPSNRRVLLVGLSEQGRSLLRECEPLVGEIEDRMLAGMPEEQREAFRNALVQGCAQLSDIARPGLAAE